MQRIAPSVVDSFSVFASEQRSFGKRVDMVLNDPALDFDGCLKDADWEVGCGPSCIVQTTDGLRCQEGIVRQRKGLKRMVFGPGSHYHLCMCENAIR